MPAAKAVLKEKIEKGITTISEKNSELNQSLLQVTRRMIPTFKRLLRNRALDFLIIGDVLFYLQSGINSFGPKIYEKIFRLKQTEVGKILGFFHGGGFVLGVILGGLLVRKKDWHPKKLLFIYLILSLVSIPFILGVLLHCPTTETKPPVSEECNSDCTCTTELYDPVCDTSTQTTYFSPCFSGCHDFQGNMSSVQQYTNCSCVAGGLLFLANVEAHVKGECGYLFITTTHTVIKFAGFIANNVIYQRVVAESDRTVAQGLRQFARKALGTLPAPLLYGLIIDQHCNIWRKYKDGTVGNCWVYDLETMIRWLCVVQVALRLLSCGFYFLCWLAYPDKIPTMEAPDLGADNKMESSAEVTL
ncbi:LOW QUALITY PROTEIN: solute carrier organic anion transporter family member 4A1-like [Bolinopsis microptera]|uniref:LOW QUALITY PROTEIN: solute carrier organic anion transporter family member 4A1-like n=1 Tax=Bolinopsis microptera TaxID=2820187 RepID=UPI00307A9649